ncbi:hypothetical protein CPC08DRAFT_23936 [Agrocybe pediades]|nr:hypothetical protein CPC08DRAFT_23936 [Agrocybe pediades]
MVSSSVESSPSSHSSTRLSNGTAIKCTTLQNPRTQDVFQSIVKGRKSWKTLRGGEVVWPPELEAALIEGLENYQPDDSRETRLLGRFPMRNRFISDWIFKKTGKRRTAKQVGSRLQQLRDTCGGKRLLHLLSPVRKPFRIPSQSPEYQHKDNHLTSPTTPTEAHATLQSLLYRGVEPRIEETPETVVYIDLLHQVDAVGNNMDDSMEDDEHVFVERGYNVLRASQQPRLISEIDATITLMSRTPTSAKSYFTVHTDDGIVYSESTDLEPVEDTTNDDCLLYRTSLVPGYWHNICRSPDATRFVIIQRVVQDGASSSASTPTIFSAMYRFKYLPSPSPMDEVYSAPAMVPMDNTVQNFDTLLSLDASNFTEMMPYNQKSQGFVDFPYMNCDWNMTSSQNIGVYPTPEDCNRQVQVVMHDQQILMPTSSFPMSDISHYS